MSYVVYNNIITPNQAIERMDNFLKSRAFEYFQDLEDDFNIYDRKDTDGKRLGVYDRNGEYFVQLRSANGVNIFGLDDEETMDTMGKETDELAYKGIGLIASEDYAQSTRWYNQFYAPKEPGKNSKACGCWMPIPNPDKPPLLERKEPPLFVPNPVKVVLTPPEEPEKPLPVCTVRYYDDPDDYDTIEGTSGAEFKRMYLGYGENDKHEPWGTFVVFDSLFHAFSKDYVVVGLVGRGYSKTYLDKGTPLFPLPNKASYDGVNYLTKEKLETLSLSLEYNDPNTAGPDPNVEYKGMFWCGANADDYFDWKANTWASDSTAGFHPGCYYTGQFIQNIPNYGSQLMGWNASQYIRHVWPPIDHGVITNTHLVCVTTELWDKILNSRKNYDDYQVKYAKYLDDYAKYVEEQRKLDLEYGNALTKYLRFITKLQEYLDWANGVDWWITSMFNYYNTLKRYDLYCNDIRDTYGNTTIFSLVKKPNYKVLKLSTLERPVFDKIPEEPSDPTDKEAVNSYNIVLENYHKEVLEKSVLLWKYLYDIYIAGSIVYDTTSSDKLLQTTHLVFGNLSKYTIWEGGIFISGSANNKMMKKAHLVYDDEDESDKNIRPVLGSGDYSTTFLRINADDAYKEENGEIVWFSSGTDNITGRRLSLPVRTGTGNGEIPNYRDLQSKSRLDWGSDINLVSGLSVRMPIFMAIHRDFDDGEFYSAVGDVIGIHHCCLLNMQTTGVYKFGYPFIVYNDQVFPYGKRRGHYGFDGISVYQLDEGKQITETIAK